MPPEIPILTPPPPLVHLRALFANPPSLVHLRAPKNFEILEDPKIPKIIGKIDVFEGGGGGGACSPNLKILPFFQQKNQFFL